MNPLMAYVLVFVVNGPSVPINGAPVFTIPSVTVAHFNSWDGCQRALKVLRGYSERNYLAQCIVDPAETPEGRTPVKLPKAE